MDEWERQQHRESFYSLYPQQQQQHYYYQRNRNGGGGGTSSSSSWSWGAIFGIASVIFVIVLVFLYSRKSQIELVRHQSKQTAVDQCARLARPSDTIFVIIATPPPPASSPPPIAAALTIRSLYIQAACPYRIFVGLPNFAVLEQLRTLISTETQRTGYDLSYIERNVRLHHRGGAAAAAAAATAAAICTSSYRNEKYILVTTSGVEFTEHWDARVLDQMHKCTLSGSQRPIVTTMSSGSSAAAASTPSLATPPQQFFLCCRETHDASRKSSSSRHRSSSRQQHQPSAASVAVEVFSRPIAKTQYSATKMLPQLFYSHCFAFTYATAYAEAPFGAQGDDDVAMSARLWAAGWDFYAPASMYITAAAASAAAVTFQMPVEISRAAAAASSHEQQQQRSISAYEHFADVALRADGTAAAGPRALLGIVNPNDAQEILIKYGSNEAYLLESERIAQSFP